MISLSPTLPRHGADGEVSLAQPTSAIQTTRANSNSVATLATPFGDLDAEALRNKVNELISASRRNPWGKEDLELWRLGARIPRCRHFRLDPRGGAGQDPIRPHFGVTKRRSPKNLGHRP